MGRGQKRKKKLVDGKLTDTETGDAGTPLTFKAIVDLKTELVAAGYSEQAFWSMTLEEVEANYAGAHRKKNRDRAMYLLDMQQMLAGLLGDRTERQKLGKHVNSLLKGDED